MQMLPSSLLLAQDQGSGKLKKLHVTCSATHDGDCLSHETENTKGRAGCPPDFQGLLCQAHSIIPAGTPACLVARGKWGLAFSVGFHLLSQR